MSRGLFITLEGGEGAGKSTQQALLLRRLRAAGVRAQSTREPGATPLGVEIRALLIEFSDESPAPTTELLLYLADRAQHVASLVGPLLAEGVCVVCDRFADSSEVYQGRTRGLGWERVRELNRWICGPVWPDLTLVLDLDPAQGLQRVAARQGELGLGPDRLENEGLEFHRRVRQGFREQAAAEPGRVRLVDASQPAEAVAAAIWDQVEPLVRAWREGPGAA